MKYYSDNKNDIATAEITENLTIEAYNIFDNYITIIFLYNIEREYLLFFNWYQ